MLEANGRDKTDNMLLTDGVMDKVIIILLLLVVICCMTVIITFIRNKQKTDSDKNIQNLEHEIEKPNGSEGNNDFTQTKSTLTLAKQNGRHSNSISVKKMKTKLKLLSDVLIIDDDTINYNQMPNTLQMIAIRTETTINYNNNNNDIKNNDISPISATRDGGTEELYNYTKRIPVNDDHQTPQFPNLKLSEQKHHKTETNLSIYKLEGTNSVYNNNQIASLPVTPLNDNEAEYIIHNTPNIDSIALPNNNNYDATKYSDNGHGLNDRKYDLKVMDADSNDDVESDDEKRENVDNFNFNKHDTFTPNENSFALPTNGNDYITPK